MEFAEVEDGGIFILNLKGDIDLHHSPTLRGLLQKKIEAKCPALIVNFEEVNYIDSSGLATLVEYYQGCRSYSGKIALSSMNERVKSVFDLVRLTEVFPIHDTLDESKTALASA